MGLPDFLEDIEHLQKAKRLLDIIVLRHWNQFDGEFQLETEAEWQKRKKKLEKTIAPSHQPQLESDRERLQREIKAYIEAELERLDKGKS